MVSRVGEVTSWATIDEEREAPHAIAKPEKTKASARR
jgi:hypothetical protein